MNLTDITTLAGARKRRKRIGRGRGTGHGKTCGRGHKGAGQRSGWRGRVLQEGGQMPVARRIPKRGFNNARFSIRYAVVNVGALERHFPDNAEVTAEALRQAGLVRNSRLPVKVLGEGSLSRKLTVEAARFSKSAAQKIETAGGSVRIVS